MPAEPLGLADRLELAHTELAMVDPPRTEDEALDVAIHWSVCDWSLMPDAAPPLDDQDDFDTIHDALTEAL